MADDAADAEGARPGEDETAGEATGPDLDDAADELYGRHPEEFVARRGELVAAARAVKDRETATAIGALRKPSQGAWLANVLARESPDEIGALEDLGAALREAQDRMDGPTLRAATAQRRELVGALVTRARRLARADGVKVGDAAARDLERTIAAALADPAAARAVAAGRLTTALEPGASLDTGTVASAPPAPRRPPPRRPGASTPAPDAHDRRRREREEREEEEREQREQEERAARERALTRARARVDDAAEAAERLRGRARAAERDAEDAAGTVATLTDRLERARRDEQQAREHAEATAADRERAEQELADARRELEDAHPPEADPPGEQPPDAG